MSKGRFGIHGGQYIPETLMRSPDKKAALESLNGSPLR